jgi:hypothetical protein
MNNLITKVAENLKRNNMVPYIVETKGEILPLLKTILPDGASVGVGGSVTLDEIGVVPFLREGNYAFFDRYAEGLSRPETVEVMRNALLADTFITSSNAVTEKGELYNVDGNGNRVAALCFGPKEVIVIVGANKIVKDLKAAEERVKTIAAPKNCQRLGLDSPCSKLGQCASMKMENREMCDGCFVDSRICSTYVLSGYQRVKDRIKVIICKENMGY